MRYRGTWGFFCFFFFQEYRVVFTFFCSRNFAESVDMVMRTWYFSAKIFWIVRLRFWELFGVEKGRWKTSHQNSENLNREFSEIGRTHYSLSTSNFCQLSSTLLKNFQISHSKMFLEYNIDILFPSINWVAKTLTG